MGNGLVMGGNAAEGRDETPQKSSVGRSCLWAGVSAQRLADARATLVLRCLGREEDMERTSSSLLLCMKYRGICMRRFCGSFC